MRNGEGEKRKKREIERERERSLAGKRRIGEADTGQRYVHRIENRDSPRVMSHTRILTLIVC